MTLIPMTEPCVQVARIKGREAEIIWRLQPHQFVSYMNEKKMVSGQADAADTDEKNGYSRSVTPRGRRRRRR